MAEMAGTGRRDRWRGLAAGAVALVVLCGCSSGGQARVAPPPASATAPPTTARPTGAEVAAAVRVVGSGVTSGQVVGCNTAGGQATGWYRSGCPAEQREPIQDSLLYGSVSYGIVLENTSDQLIWSVPVTIRFLDGAGEVIHEHPTPFSDPDLTGLDEDLGILRPGERVGVGGMTYPGSPDVADIRVEVGEAIDWMPVAQWAANNTSPEAPSVAMAGELTVTDLAVRTGDHGEPVTSVTVESSYAVDVTASNAYAIFRDAEGRVIGGADAWDVPDIPAGGTAELEIALDDPLAVPDIDQARTEVYLPGLRVVQR